MDLFSLQEAEAREGFEPGADTSAMPLAARMRPRTLDEVAGQKHLLAPGKLLRRAIETDRFTSLIFYGPPGCGKTTLAAVIARTTNAHFMMLNGVESNVADIREKIAQAQMRMSMHGRKTVLFVDELHRFNKAQQDVLLPHLEKGTVRFIGATTENPYFAINSPLLSRSQVFPLEPVPEEDLAALLKRALTDEVRGLGSSRVDMEVEALNHLAAKADGDARKALTALEVAVLSTPAGKDGIIHVDISVAEESIQRKAIRYDRLGDSHYDTISAFIKSMRGSGPVLAGYDAGSRGGYPHYRKKAGHRSVGGCRAGGFQRPARSFGRGARGGNGRHAGSTHSSGACCGLPGDGPQEQFRLRGHQCRHG